ncbi:MAG: hypothetical protein WC845_03900 [Candidatus Staskawiczbacteria bacterium]|jgi:hypothetical protein
MKYIDDEVLTDDLVASLGGVYKELAGKDIKKMQAVQRFNESFTLLNKRFSQLLKSEKEITETEKLKRPIAEIQFDFAGTSNHFMKGFILRYLRLLCF